MLQNLKKFPELEQYIRVQELQYYGEIKLSSKGKTLIQTSKTFSDIDAANKWVQTTLRAEAGKGFGSGMTSLEKALQTEQGLQDVFDKTVIDTPEKQQLMKKTSEECLVDVASPSTIDMTPIFLTSTLRQEKPRLLPVSPVLFYKKHLASIRMHFIRDRFHI